jgi:hypothetical protein
MLEDVEKSALDGSLAKHLAHDVIGWHVTNHQLLEKPHRLKRQAGYYRYTATLQPERVAPTKANAIWGTDTGTGPGVRIVPSRSESVPHSKGHRKHHRGKKPRGRHHHPKDRYLATATPYPSAPAATPVPTLIVPSRVVTVQPTKISGKDTDDVKHTKTTDGLQPSSNPEETDKVSTKALPDVTIKKKKVQTTSPPTKPTDHKPTDHKPTITQNLGEYECVEGKYCEHQLPKIGKMFYDIEDKSALELSFMRADGLGLPQHTWIKYDKEK